MDVRVKELRQASGMTQGALADAVGISRQALAAIEAGRSVPGTGVALDLAHTLGCRVEDLFVRPPDRLAVWSEAPVGSRVTLGRTASGWVAWAASTGESADGVLEAPGTALPWRPLVELEGTVFAAGCAPLLGLLAARTRGVRLVWLPRSSGDALQLLADGRVHAAGLHLGDPDGGWNLPAIRAHLGEGRAEVRTLCGWVQGLATAAGCDPAVLDGLRVVRRPTGAGASALLQRRLRELGDPPTLPGPAAPTHGHAALAVMLGAADAAVTLEATALEHGLRFAPWQAERFDLAFDAELAQGPAVRAVLDALEDPSFAREAALCGPYDMSGTGGRVA